MEELKMSEGQARRRQAEDEAEAGELQEPIKYSDVFQVSGELGDKAITPQDAASLQAAENMALGHTQKGGPAALMQSAASVNQNQRRLHDVTTATGEQAVTVSDAEVAGHHIITESVGGQVVGQYVVRGHHEPTTSTGGGGDDLVTIGEALEAAAISAGEKAVEESDAAAIQAAEVRATGRMQVMPGGVAAKAQGAASQNARTMRHHDKTKLGDVLADASTLLLKDKVVTREDAEGVIGAEIRNQPQRATYPGGVAASMAAAARLNQSNN